MTSRLLNSNHSGRALSAALALAAGLATADARANAVTEWNTKTAALVNAQTPMEQTRSFAIVQLAVHDALNAIEPRYAAYAFEGRSPEASPEAAIARAARDTLLALVPDAREQIELAYTEALAAVPDGQAEALGIDVGRGAAERLVSLRAADDVVQGLTAPYTPGTEIGDYQPTPPSNVVFGAAWGKLAPFSLPRSSAFRPAPPPSVSGRRYARDYAEVKSIGEQGSTTRTAEQTEIADFWYESSATGWVRITNLVATARDLDLWESARVLGLVSVALADGFINGFDAKYHYEYWRPITAIRVGDDDGNRKTAGDADWTPHCETPPVADYPSTHSVLGAAAAAVLARYFGDETAFEIDSLTLPGVTRRFDRFSQAAEENGDSRVYCGIHWRSSVRAGLEQGRRIGHYVFEHELGRAHRH